MQILIDTSFILDCIKYKIDMLTELRRIIQTSFTLAAPQDIIKELKKSKQQKLAISLLDHLNIAFFTSAGNTVDDQLLSYALEKKAIVATQDRKLKEKLKKAGLEVLTIRKKSHFLLT